MTLQKILILSVLFTAPLAARVRLSSFCQQGGAQVVTSGQRSTTKAQQSFPGATVNVYYTGGATGYATSSGNTLTWTSGITFNANSGWVGLTITYNGNPFVIASVASINSLTTTTSLGTNTSPLAWSMPATAPAAIYSDNTGTPKSNPYTCDSTTAQQFIYGEEGFVSTYDFRFSGTGVTSPFTLSAQSGVDPFAVPQRISSRAYQIEEFNFYQACADAVTRGLSLSLDVPWYGIGSSSTCSASIQGQTGGLIQPAAGQVVTLSVMPSCPAAKQCFDASKGGAGSILFLAPTGSVAPEWFGVAVGTSNGVANQAALAAAIRALPIFGSNPQGVVINQGSVKFGATGNTASYYPLSSTVLLSPHVTLSGADTGQTSIKAQSGFSGSWVFDSINQNGTGVSPNNNFSQGLSDLLIDTTTNSTAVTGCVQWLASLHSHLDQLNCHTRGVAFSIGSEGFGDDNTTGESLEADLFSQSSSDTQVTAQGYLFPGQSNETLTNTFTNLKCGYSSAFPTSTATTDSGFILSTLGCLATESGVNGLVISGFNSENHPRPITIGPGTSNTRITAIAEYADCGTSCIQGAPAGSPSGMVPYYPACANIISPLSQNVHLEGYANHFKNVLCIGNPWTPATAYISNQTVIDANGHIQAVQVPGTSAAVPPDPATWNSSGGFTTDGTVTWFDGGAITAVCDPNQNAGQIFDVLTGSEGSCLIQSISNSTTRSMFGTSTGPFGASSSSDNANYFFYYDSNSFWNPSYPASGATLINSAPAVVDMNVTTDQLLVINYPRSYTRAILRGLSVGACSTDLSAGGGITRGGFYAATSKTGGFVAGSAATTYSSLTAISKFEDIPINATYTTPGTIFAQGVNDAFVFSLTTGAGFAATCEVTPQFSYLP